MKKTVIVLWLAAMCMMNVHAEVNLEVKQIKKLHIEAYDVVSKYMILDSRLHDEIDRDDLLGLFESEYVMVPQDYFPAKQDSVNSRVTIQQHIDMIGAALEAYRAGDSCAFKNSNPSMGKIYPALTSIEDEDLIVKLRFYRTLDFYNLEGVHFPKFDEALCYCVTLVARDYAQPDAEMRIRDIQMENSGDYADMFLYDGSKELKPITQKPEEVDNTPIKGKRCELYCANYDHIFKTDSFAIKNAVGVSLAYGYRLPQGYMPQFAESVRDAQFQAQSHIFEVGLTYYRELARSKTAQSRFGLQLSPRFGYGMTTFSGAYKDIYVAVDPDGGEYERRITLTDYQEQSQTYTVSLPVALREDFYFNRRVGMFVSVGANMKYQFTETSKAQYTALYEGYYDWLWDLVIRENGVYNFGLFEGQEKACSRKPHSFSVDLEPQLGVQVFVSPRLSLEAAVLYRYCAYVTPAMETGIQITTEAQDWHGLGNTIYGQPHQVGAEIRLMYNF